MDPLIAIIITLVTCLIVCFFCYRKTIELKLIYIILGISIYLYSGLGISYNDVKNIYIIDYSIFLVVLFLTIQKTISTKIRIILSKYSIGKMSIINQYTIEKMLTRKKRIVCCLCLAFFLSMLFYMVYPTNRLSELLSVSNFSSHGIHNLRYIYNSNKLLKLSDAIRLITQPFFFIFLYYCATGSKTKQFLGSLSIVLWIVLSFGKFHYISRYQMVVFLLLIFAYQQICQYKELIIDKKIIIKIMILAIILIPFLVAFTDMRLGRSVVNIGFLESIGLLLESECYYPRYYDICIKNSNLVSPIQYILWLLFLPVPNFIWADKPMIQIAYEFTSMFSSLSVTDAAYSNLLPSILGEAFLIYGEYFFWVHAVILGFLIGVIFRVLLKSKKLSILSAYFIIILATIGRGGSQSYAPFAINSLFSLFTVFFMCNSLKFRDN